MVSYIILICSVLASTGALSPRLSHQNNAASESQIRFAIENKYDDTGPGATGRESAYRTYKTLEEALISYLDDPDTKLPNYERERALAGLQIPPIHTPIRQYPKSVEEYTGYKNTERPEQIRYNTPKQYYSPVDVNSYELNNIQNDYLKVNDGLRVQRVQPIKSRPLNLAHYQQNPQIEETFNSFDPNPQYSFSYGVHDKVTGDRKSAHESREGGVVRGYYSFMDPEGSQRTVHYTADDLRGFRATVQRSP